MSALAEDGSRRPLKLESFWPHKGQVVLKFAGVDSISDAETLVACELQIPAGERAELDKGASYVSDLVGCTVWNTDQKIGVVSDVRFGSGEAPLLVVEGAREYEIPFAEAFLAKVDVPGKQIRMKLPEGLLNVNAPVTEEEKAASQSSSAGSRRRGQHR